jgi:streptogramin lyase
MHTRQRLWLTALLALTAALAALPAFAGDIVLTGTITSPAGEKLGGVTVSAKGDGSTITRTVFTDAAGDYYFPPLPGGSYRVWAQALGYQAARAELALGTVTRQDFAMRPEEDLVRQLPGDLLLAALPEETPDDQRMKRIVRVNCTGCHTPSYVLQHRFDEAGWNAIIELMKHVNVYGAYQGPDHKANAVLDLNQTQLAAYLARARGPGESAMNIKLRPRPAGEAARVMFAEYDVPLDPAAALPPNFVANDGSDWSMGTPSVLIPGFGVHDAWADLDGNLWFTCNIPNPTLTIGRIDAKTGAFKPFKVDASTGFVAQTHGMTRDPNGIIWFNINTGRGGLGRLDPKTEAIEVFMPPEGMSPNGGATTVDYDGKGKIWVSAPDGALRFDPDTKTFTEFKSRTFKTANGTGLTYGVAADRDGNGYWAEMALDIIGRSEMAARTSLEIKLPPVQAEFDRVPPQMREAYQASVQADFNTPFPWAQGPRRMGTDKNADVLWVGNSWGASLARIDTHTLQVSFVPLPGTRQPYHVAVDRNHAAWTNLWMTDEVMRYDPTTSTWTAFDLPSRGFEARYVSLLEREGSPTQVILPSFRLRKVAVMTLRSEAELAALKAQAK